MISAKQLPGVSISPFLSTSIPVLLFEGSIFFWIYIVEF